MGTSIGVGLGAACVVALAVACGGDSTTNGGNGTPPPGGGTPNPDGTCGGGGGPTGGPADLFPCDSPWYQDVTSAPVASDSASILAGIGAWGTGKFRIDNTSFHFAHADASTPRHTFTLDYASESDSDPVPVPPDTTLEGETGLTCTTGGDCHLIVIDDAAHKLFELYAVQSAVGPYTAAQESVWDLTRHYGPQGRGYGCTSADAAGLSVMAGLIGVREAKAGSIKHALRFILPNAKIRKGPSFVPPASHGTSATRSDAGPAYGMRLRLKPSFDASSIATSGGKAIVQALKTYGMMLADGGNYALSAEDDTLEKKADPSMSWDGVLAGGDDLAAIQPTDFEVLQYGPLRTDTSCALVK